MRNLSLSLSTHGLNSAFAQTLSQVGRWTGLFDINGSQAQDYAGATHMILARGPLDSALVVMYHQGGTARLISYPPQLLPWANLDATHLPTHPAPIPHLDAFCSGHAALADGRILVVSGTARGVNGHHQAKIFRPERWRTGDSLWTSAPDLEYARWYPTATTLPDGKVIVTSGLHYFDGFAWGGDTLSTGGPVPASRANVSLALTDTMEWKRYGYYLTAYGDAQPESRKDHTLLFANGEKIAASSEFGAMVMFGGIKSGTATNELWLAWRKGLDRGEQWDWYQPAIDTNSTIPVEERVLPPARSEHVAVMNEYQTGMFEMWVYGGKDVNGQPLDDLWRVRIIKRSYPGQPGGLPYVSAKQITYPTANQPGSRYAAVAVYDEGVKDMLNPRMLLFGGRTAGGSLADNKVYALRLTGANDWAIVHDGSGTAPGARARAAAVFKPANDGYAADADHKARMFMFGGEGASSGTKLADLWRLSRCNNNANCIDSYTWKLWNAPSGTAPRARSHHAMLFDNQWGRLVVHGGFSPDSMLSDVWSMNVDIIQDACANDVPCNLWLRKTPVGGTFGHRAGHSLTYYALWDVENHTLEVYDPAAGTNGGWTSLENPEAQKFDRQAYPFMFVLPSGRVLYAGRNGVSVAGNRAGFPDSISSVGAGTNVLSFGATPDWGPHMGSGIGGAQAVMYEPGKVMKCGVDDNNDERAFEHASFADFSAHDWVPWDRTLDSTTTNIKFRIEANLVLLADGQVLAVGGRRDHEPDSDPQLEPQLWNPEGGNRRFGPPLGQDGLRALPTPRGYHSTAVLLPDGRVISAGGFGSGDAVGDACIFDPPYLFDGDTLAARPRLGFHPDTVRWGQVVSMATARRSTLRKVTLLRPGAPTHAFDQNQRYVPLTWAADTESDSAMWVTAPASGGYAPPGDYMLFLVDSVSTGARRVPSFAKWVRVMADKVRPNPPAKINESSTCSQITLGVAATADDGVYALSGNAFKYRVRYGATTGSSTITDTTTWWNSLDTLATPPVPVRTGYGQSISVNGLAANTYYWVGMRLTDRAGNQSHYQTWKVLTQASCGGGGGGGCGCGQYGDGLLSGDPRSAGLNAAQSAEAPARETRLLQGLADGAEATDAVPYLGPVGAEGAVYLDLRALPERHFEFDRVRLLSVEHPATEEAVWAGDRMLVGRREALAGLSRTDSTGAVLGAVSFADSAVVLGEGEALAFTLESVAAGDALVVELGECDAPRGLGLALEAQGDGDAWQAVGQVRLRGAGSVDAMPGIGAGAHRLLAHEPVTIRGVGLLHTAGSLGIQIPLAPLAASGPGGGDNGASLAARDSMWLSLAPDDTVRLTFQLPAPTGAFTRSLFLEVHGRPWTVQGRGASQLGTQEVLPTRFALGANRPNPFAGSTEIRFDMPVRSRVKLELFDAQGRRVRTLVEGAVEAGRHSVTWDGTAANGIRLAPGVYHYRMQAPGYEAKRRLVRLP